MAAPPTPTTSYSASDPGFAALPLDLRFNSVAAGSRFAEAKPLRRSTVETFDGLVAHIDEFEADDKTYARFDFSYDASLVHPDAAKAAAASAEAKEPPPIPGTEAKQPAAETTPKETVEQEAARLKARTAGWVYELPDYKMRMLTKRLDDLVQSPVKDEAKAEGGMPGAKP